MENTSTGALSMKTVRDGSNPLPPVAYKASTPLDQKIPTAKGHGGGQEVNLSPCIDDLAFCGEHGAAALTSVAASMAILQ